LADPAAIPYLAAVNIRQSVAHALDDTATALARAVLLRRTAETANTLDELRVYEQHSIVELFGDAPAMPAVTPRERRTLRGFRWTDLAFPSAHEAVSAPFRTLQRTGDPTNQTVHARWIRHTDGRRRPTMVFLHSWMAPVSRVEDVVLLPRFARALDVDVVSMHLPYHGLRKPRASAFHGEYFWTADLVRTFEALRQSVHDARALIAWLHHQAPTPVGVLGVSLGGIVALALACFEPRLAFAIPVAAHLDLAGALEDAQLLTPMRVALARRGFGPEDVAAHTRSLGLHEVTPCIPRERIMLVMGRYDRILTAPRTEALWARWDKPRLHTFPGGHMGIITHLGGILRESRSFLDGLDLGR
jgi:pimeloyl-ACP methyl ester carboxylesterase